MLRRVLAPLHPDGFKFVAAGVLATLLLFLLWAPAGWAAAIATLWMVYFFRDPWRVTPTRPGLLISPADGIVVSIAAATPPPELAMGDMAMVRIFKLREAQSVEARIEAYNVTNSLRLGTPITNFSTGNFGQVNSSLDPRLLQFALKYVF